MISKVESVADEFFGMSAFVHIQRLLHFVFADQHIFETALFIVSQKITQKEIRNRLGRSSRHF